MEQTTSEVGDMLNQEMLNKLRYMKMTGMVEALEHQEEQQGFEELKLPRATQSVSRQ